ncbi:phospholipase D family protein [Moraxella haemolytica]|uniref:phospholipase D family protein n=1 Tax=Moraxella haemolytica TaxID=2904119 RepID=UPI002543F4C1|nr:phospholipase D family protein [Moraxella sp. ZY171148]WII95144.1 phospholipase D family protein [Moraxella sp. ZY171148]
MLSMSAIKGCIKRFLIGLLILTLFLIFIGLATYRPLPDNSHNIQTTHLATNPDSKIAKMLLPEVIKRKDESGVYVLADSRDAFLARLALVESAQDSLDVQYYIYHDDLSGRLLSQRLLAAADRGVRVRLLLDDHTMAGMDGVIKALDNHDRIEVRLFNPYMHRTFRPLGYLSDFFRLNRRMHNKSMTADSLVSIVGGRNIGDEYFDAGSGVMFADLDVAVVGDASRKTANDFDRYWNSRSSYMASDIIGKVAPADLSGVSEASKAYLQLLTQTNFAKYLTDGDMPLVWAKTQLISDHPDKVLKKHKDSNILVKYIAPLIQNTQQELIIVSPYFVPTNQGKRLLSELAKNGKSVQVLTNTLAANDVAVVHSGYAKYREDLLQSGVRLYELKDNATVKPAKVRNAYDGQGASLHAKTFMVDGRYLYVGSFNMDPRSANLNTEMGLIIESPVLAERLVKDLSTNIPTHTYALSLNDEGKKVWTTTENGQLLERTTEPDSPLHRRIQVWIASHLPIEWLL